MVNMSRTKRENKAVIGFALPKQAIEKINNLAFRIGLSRSEYLRTLVLKHLEEKE